MSILNTKFRLSEQSRLFKFSLPFIALHIALILALGSITALAPDESGTLKYLARFIVQILLSPDMAAGELATCYFSGFCICQQRYSAFWVARI